VRRGICFLAKGIVDARDFMVIGITKLGEDYRSALHRV
jgi:hypothetical protein